MQVKKESIEDESAMSSLEDNAIKRLETLKNLKRKREESTKDDNTSGSIQESFPKPKFRSYKPQDKGLSEHVLDKPKIESLIDLNSKSLDVKKDDYSIDKLDISKLAPRQPDLDLKRDIQDKLQKLERQTQKSIVELIRERLKTSGDLADIVNSSTKIIDSNDE